VAGTAQADRPDCAAAAVLRDAATPSGIGQFGIIQAVASSVGLEVFPVHIRDAAAIESALASLARSQDGGVIVGSSGRAIFHQTRIISLAAEHKLPAVYWDRALVGAGGLMSYGPNFLDQHRRAAGYVDRILRGEKPGDLPVQAPTKYELVINLKTAKALGLDVPPTLLARADEVIE
jgi:putative ABC transport system substrate-binding protein